MKIHNIRMGLAMNSSSTHSLIFMSPDKFKKLDTDTYSEFGWEFFTAANKQSKENYLGFILKHTLDDIVGESNANLILDGVFKNRPDFSRELNAFDYGIDHQSVFALPLNWDGKGVNLDFFEALRDYIVDNPVAILGGNDNTDEVHKHASDGEGIELGLPKDIGVQSGLVARKDGDHWVVFNRESGAKIRLSFKTKNTEVNVVKAPAPELVDIKITDFCPYGCTFCYQASTTEGKHADTKLIENVAYALKDMQVFEVAIGGGEPTLHPDFKSILKTFRMWNIVPNFTTKNLAWLNDAVERKEILELCGGFAYSATTREEVQKLANLIEKYEIPKSSWNDSKVSVQYVLESGGDLYGVLDEAAKHYIRVTLLGFKSTGFGKHFQQVPEDWIEVVQKFQKEKRYLNLAVDTAIIQKYGESIRKKLGVREELVTAQEGKFSMYIDTVEQRMAPSSYCLETDYKPLPMKKDYRGKPYALDGESLLQTFKGW